MIHRVEPGTNAVAHLCVGPVVPLAFFVLDHATLLVQGLLRHGAEQVTHAVAFHPQRHVECAGRHGREIVGAILGRRAVHSGRSGIHER